ncbi:hypothetical protein MY4824_007884 [Beauveria thailandica]
MMANSFTSASLPAIAGILGSAWTSGAIASLTLVGIPTARAIPQASTQIWHGLFLRGMALLPKVAVGTALSYVYAAYNNQDQKSMKGYLVAAGLVVSIVPFTIIFMGSTNAALIGSATGSSPLQQAQALDIIRKWGYLNLTRSVLPLTAAAVGLRALLN